MPDEYIKRDTAINEAICAVYWALNQHGNVTGMAVLFYSGIIFPLQTQLICANILATSYY